MKIARGVNAFFEYSTQAMKQLLDIQNDGGIALHAMQPFGVKTLQDVVTRWWSTYRSLKRLRWLKPAIKTLKAQDLITCDIPTNEQWIVLHQIEICLTTMALWQRALEGEYYVTSSLVVLAVHMIRRGYSTIMECVDTLAPVKHLCEVLLRDFNQRYEPGDEHGKVKYTSKPEVGYMKRHAGVHPYFFFAALLDPRTKCKLQGTKKKKAYNMTKDDFEQLKSDVVNLMVDRVQLNRRLAVEREKATKEAGENMNNDKKDGGDEEEAAPIITTMDEMMFGDMENDEDEEEDEGNNRENTVKNETKDMIRVNCKGELELYLLAEGIKIKNDKGDYNNPLEWWKTHKDDYPILVELAMEFLSIPATSAASERVWSRAAQVLSTKRARLSEKVASNVLFVKENLEVLRKHYATLIQGQEDALPLEASGLPEPDASLSHIDVGQDIISRNF